ncbi:hypothetical protein AB0M46_00605 [Dactylosporangium sp. NPDC051485]|uniref:hypothetical protein n=1 Tax=Dactylosporangium sp. NPDC051485 TaxID=3154846 RepID=UPI00343F1B9C
MATTDHTGVPRVDDAVDIDTIRDEAEEIAVPAFDYIAQPIDAVVDGLIGHGHDEDRDTENTQVDE